MSDYTEHLISMAGGDGEPLDAIQRRVDAATPGHWEASIGMADQSIIFMPDGYSFKVNGHPDARFIAHARTDIPALLALVREQAAQIGRVRELHTFAHTDVEPWAAGYRYSGDHCGSDGEHWPCPTIAALTATEGA